MKWIFNDLKWDPERGRSSLSERFMIGENSFALWIIFVATSVDDPYLTQLGPIQRQPHPISIMQQTYLRHPYSDVYSDFRKKKKKNTIVAYL